MKRIVLYALAVAALLAVGCNKQDDGPKSTYRITVDKNANVRLAEGTTITTTFFPKTEDDALSTDITVTFKVDPDRLSGFMGETATLLPESNYSFKKNPVIVEAERRFDPTGREYCRLDIRHTSALKPETTYVLPVVIESITGNGGATFDPDEVLYVVVKTNRTGAGSGTEDVPYVIETVSDLQMMDDYAVAGQTTYFKLMNDIDFAAVEDWEPVCTDADNPMYVDFNGDNKTLKNFTCTDKAYASIFGCVSGMIHDFRIENATVTAQDYAADIAIVAYSIGVDGELFPSELNNITISNSKVEANLTDGSQINEAFVAINARNTTFRHVYVESSNTMKLYFNKSMSTGVKAAGILTYGSSLVNIIQCGNAADLIGYNQKQIGGIVGSLLSGHISECWNTGTVSGNEDVAGIVGQIGQKKGSSVDTDEWTITNCYNKGQIRITGQRGGGICGCPFNSVKIENCYNIGDVTAICRKTDTGEDDPDHIDGRCIGGIAGHVCGGAGVWDFNVANSVTINNCHVYSALIQANTGDKTEERPGCGAIVGYTSLKNTYKDCYRSAATVVDNSKTLNPHDPFDQGNCSPESPLNTGSVAPVQKWAVPYHGVRTDKTLSELLSTCGWDGAIWDFSTGALKNNPEI